MRILVCGDTHCKDWILPQAVEATKWDYFVFLGDACDNFGASQEDNIRMIKQLIELKKKYGKKFVWLLGNHDWGYYDDTIRMTGHIRAGEANVHYLLKENIDLWDLFFAKGPFIFSHAGISANFMQAIAGIPYKAIKESPGVNNPMNEVGAMCGGLSDTPSLLWARPEEIEPLVLDNIQVVGHTPVFYISRRPNNLVLCDTFSQFKDGRVIGDETLLLLEGKLSSNDWKMTAIGLDGEFAYDVK